MRTVQDSVTPEIALLFYNGSKHEFGKDQEQVIDTVIQNHFLEYLKEDLSEVKAKSDYVKLAPAGGLLGGEERVGIERLIECFECCMWSSMVKKAASTSGIASYSSSALVAPHPIQDYVPPT